MIGEEEGQESKEERRGRDMGIIERGIRGRKTRGREEGTEDEREGKHKKA